jgi:anti-anti-sigma regulatory factor
MLRITLISQDTTDVVLKVEGWIAGDDVDLLACEGNRCLEQSRRLVLALSGVRLIDGAGLALLKQWAGERLALRGAQPFVAALLEEAGLASQEEER